MKAPYIFTIKNPTIFKDQTSNFFKKRLSCLNQHKKSFLRSVGLAKGMNMNYRIDLVHGG